MKNNNHEVEEANSDDSEELIAFGAMCPLNLLENLQHSYNKRPKVQDITFPRK